MIRNSVKTELDYRYFQRGKHYFSDYKSPDRFYDVLLAWLRRWRFMSYISFGGLDARENMEESSYVNVKNADHSASHSLLWIR